MTDAPDTDVLSTWTDELNNALRPFGILLSGADAGEFLPFKLANVLAQLRSLKEEGLGKMAAEVNDAFEIEGVEPNNIRQAVDGTISHYLNE